MVMAAPIKITNTETDRLTVSVVSFETYTTVTRDVAATQPTVVLKPDALTAAELLEAASFGALSEESFAEDWNSPEDAIYDTL